MLLSRFPCRSWILNSPCLQRYTEVQLATKTYFNAPVRAAQDAFCEFGSIQQPQGVGTCNPAFLQSGSRFSFQRSVFGCSNEKLPEQYTSSGSSTARREIEAVRTSFKKLIEVPCRWRRSEKLGKKIHEKKGSQRTIGVWKLTSALGTDSLKRKYARILRILKKISVELQSCVLHPMIYKAYCWFSYLPEKWSW